MNLSVCPTNMDSVVISIGHNQSLFLFISQKQDAFCLSGFVISYHLYKNRHYCQLFDVLSLLLSIFSKQKAVHL